MGCPPRVVRGSALQAAIASGVNQTVRLPRARRPASYAAQLMTRCHCLGMRCRRSRLALNGMAGAPLPSGGRLHPPPPEVVHPGDPCNNVRQAPRKRLPSDYYNLAIFFEPKVRNQPSVTVLHPVTCYKTAPLKIAKLQCDLDA